MSPVRAAPLTLVTLATLATALLAGALLAGCRGNKRQPTELQVPAPSPPPSQVPVDRALPDELAEGTEKAFGLPLPRLMKVRARFDDVIFVEGDIPAHRVANYVRQRVTADKVETGPVKTIFPRASVRGQPGVELTILVTPKGDATELQVRNLSLVKSTPGLTEEERWRAAGFKSDGTLLDPTHLH